MARYIDADALIEKIQETVCTKCGDIYDGIKCKSCGIDDTLNFLEDAPTADVVPRDEVRRIFEEIEEEIIAALDSNYQRLRELDDGRCNMYILELVYRIKGKIDALRGIEGFIEELKEKHTKGGEEE